MRILGVDPGTVIFGYGIIDSIEDEVKLVHYGVIRCPSRLEMPQRLCTLHSELTKIVREYLPEVMAVETPFVGENIKSALAIGKAQAVALLVSAQNNIPVFEYSPATIKSHVTDYGASSKEQIQEMVKLLLDMDDIPQPSDSADALAAAICHLRESSWGGLVG